MEFQHAINYIFAQIIVILITFLISFLITFSHSMRKMCYERTKIKICRKRFSTLTIPSTSFLQPSWIWTVTFHLHFTRGVFPCNHCRPVQDECQVSRVCMAGPNCLCVTTLRPRKITYVHDTHAVSDYVLLLHNTEFSRPLRLIVQCQLNKKPLMCQQLIIIYIIVIKYSQ